MNSAAIRNSIVQRIMELKTLIAELEEKEAKGPGNHILLSEEKCRVRFYVMNDDLKREYISIRDTARIASLSQRLYEMRLLKAAREEMRMLEICRKHLDGNRTPADANEVYNSLKPEIRKHVNPDPTTDEGYAKRWSEETYYMLERTEYHKYETLAGNYVRSKSEVIIADRLYKEGIPYRYEQRLMLDRKKMLRYYPDFTILNKRTRQIYYWEHLGLLGDPEYCADNLAKLEDYTRYGIIQGKNLILTYECADRTLSTDIVKRMIREFLV